MAEFQEVVNLGLADGIHWFAVDAAIELPPKLRTFFVSIFCRIWNTVGLMCHQVNIGSIATCLVDIYFDFEFHYHDSSQG